jgi:nicotinate-nucleotide pyrophosphorylase (carboxylating)
MKFPMHETDRIVRAALREDAPAGDVTTEATVSPRAMARAVFRAKQTGVIAGLPMAARVFALLGRRCVFKPLVAEGALVKAGAAIAEVRGPARTLLTGERAALNLLQRMSGIATLAHAYVRAVAGTGVKILDTRKTAPSLRVLDKYAVRAGGARNHRMSLSDLAMIKDNHIRAAGGIGPAVAAVRRKAPRVRIEVEAASLADVEEALRAGADIIMLDNMSPKAMGRAVKRIRGRALVEASGSISLENVRAVAQTGVDFISVGRLTHSAPALDIAMKLIS